LLKSLNPLLLAENEQSVAIWLEGLALVAIFVLELKEYRRQGAERKEQRDDFDKQLEIARKAAEAAKLNAQHLLNSERAWIEFKLGQCESDLTDETEVPDLFACSIQIENHGRTIAHVETVEIGADSVNGPLPQEPSGYRMKRVRSILGSGQKETVCNFDADTDFVDGLSIVNGEKRGILRIIVKYRDVVDATALRETSVVYLLQNSLEDPPERVSSLSVYT
jgi:hypothetical protein